MRIFSGQKKLFIKIGILLTLLLQIFASNAYALEVVISGNGSESASEVVTEVAQEVSVEQSNDAEIENDVDISANTGDNTASGNSGAVEMQTGDADIQVIVENSANISHVDNACCVGDSRSIEITDNGSSSNNGVEVERTDDTKIAINNTAFINNEITGVVNTGKNIVADNSGDVAVTTGDVSVNGKVENGPINIAAVSFSGVGNSNYDVFVGGNGAKSNSEVRLASNNDFAHKIDNNAGVVNKVVWDLDTGSNRVKDNLGDIKIVTGNIFFDFDLVNGPINTGGVFFNCCSQDNSNNPDPEDPSDPDDPNDPSDPGIGGNDPSDPGNSSNSSGDSNSSSSSNSNANDTNSVAAAVLGLSNTSGESRQHIIFWLGVVLMTFGLGIASKEIIPLYRLYHCTSTVIQKSFRVKYDRK